MNNTVTLNALAESYLKSLIAKECQQDASTLDVAMPFTEMGVDSFYVLKVVKQLENDFGALPKTLLFEYFNVQDLAQYFVDQHPEKLSELVGNVSPSATQAPEQPVAVVQPAVVAEVPPAPMPSVAVSADESPVLALEKDALANSELGDGLRTLFEQYKNEGSVSRGTRNIAQNVFIGSARKGFFNYGRSRDVLLAYAYTGPQDYFDELAGELLAHCQSIGLELNILTDAELSPIGGQEFTSTPFGVVQRVLDIDKFTMAGSSMRRLRYQVSKFEKVGETKTVEYQCGTDPKTDQDIAAIIDKWCGERTMVNPLIHIVKQEILDGRLNEQHRLFLTYLDDVLQNVILISKMVSAASGDNGYLMDLEFYPKEMPLGGLEFGIVKIIEALAAEGCNLLSMGGTYGCKLDGASDKFADPELNKVLDDLRDKNIFNDAGNLQFKNKFRPENKTIYLCRAKGFSNPHNVIDIIMMIADPEKQQVSDSENHNLIDGKILPLPSLAKAPAPAPQAAVAQPQKAPTATAQPQRAPVAAGPVSTQKPNQPRAELLDAHGYNPLNLADDTLNFDGKTDSWAQLKLPAIERQTQRLHRQMQKPVDLDGLLGEIFGFEHFVLTRSGRTAENIFYGAWQQKGKVLQNLMFPTAVYHQIDKGFTPVEVPRQDIFELSNPATFKGNVDIDALKAQLDGVAMVCIEVIDNATGGAPVSLSHLREVKAVLEPKGIPLVLDVTRIVENALFVKDQDSDFAAESVWSIVRQICRCADALTCSLAKDFSIPFGGFVATNDAALRDRLNTLNGQAGTALDVLDKKLLGQALSDKDFIERQVVRRKRAVADLHARLNAAGIPVLQPVGGHCVVFDPKATAPFSGFEHPAASFVAWLYLQTGIRAGMHSVGMQKNTPLNETVRLVVPVGVKAEEVAVLADPIVAAYAKLENIPEITPKGEKLGDINAEYRLVAYHNFNAAAAGDALPSSTVSTSVAPQVPTAQAARPTPEQKPQSQGPMSIAIVGMSGRYPKAKDMGHMWQNLLEGRDCVDQISEARLNMRRSNAFTRNYRGGFLEEVDRFDSLFFNISPREAEILDPQERLFLEVAYEAIEDAGYYPETLAKDGEPRDIGVFVGAVWALYQMIGTEAKLYGADLNPNSFLWSVANRVSFWMNLGGPSLTVDTACSSSLTALYLACEAIHNGECSGAIVGGVNLDLHQQKYDINFSGGALSPDGLCRTFGDNANGYVAGEGVGAIFLKPLQKAVNDKDTVKAVIKAAVVNHGGRTSGYTVPNPKSQSALVKKALEKAQFDARTIGYIEAHGTGTELGDPIEIRGLSQAFAPYDVPNQSCVIGSVKTNIGHLEAAAGVVGVTKILMQMKHHTLVPSLHSKTLNEHIDFDNSPFIVQQDVEPWQEKVVDGVTYPLRAGVSSFGAGGANAHILIEHYQPHGQNQAGNEQAATALIFPLSARNEGQLRDFAERLKAFVATDKIEDIDNIAFTLQVGKKSFEQRLVVIAQSKQELADKLGQFLEGHSDDSILVGSSKNAQSITRLLSDQEKSEFVSMLSSKQDPLKLAKLWVDGLLSDWQGSLATADGKLRRVPLPTYPFADKRHWIRAEQENDVIDSGTQPSLHPLIDSNESTFERQLFKKTFRSRDFVIGEHVVTNIPTLPGVAYLELARKAGELAAGCPVNRISNVLWLSPLTVESEQPNEVYIDLSPAGDHVQFEVYSDNDGAKRIYAQGRLNFGELPQQAEYLDVAGIKSRLSPVIDGKTAYPLFLNLGLQYGPSFQAIEQVYRGGGEVLGQLKLPAVRHEDFSRYQLHPALIDAAMQAGVAAQLGDESGKMMVPYSLGEVEIFGELTEQLYSYITKADNGEGKVSRENLVITDAEGKVLVKINESVGVPIGQVHDKSAAPQAAGAKSDDDLYAELYYHHQWRQGSIDTEADIPQAALLFDRDEKLFNAWREALRAAGQSIDNVLLVQPGEGFAAKGEGRFELALNDAGDYLKLLEALAGQNYPLGKIVYRWGDTDFDVNTDNLADALNQGVYGLLHLAKALIERKQLNNAEIIYLYGDTADKPQPHNEAVNGFVHSLLLENTRANCKVLDVRSDDAKAQLKALATEFGASDTTVRYENNERLVRRLTQFDLNGPVAGREPALKQRGVYLITGGAGGLGLIFAEHLARSCQARLVLTGRSELNDERKAKIAELEALGAQVLYTATDVTDVAQVALLMEQINERFGALNGIIHSAGVLRDSFLRNKTVEEMSAVLAPKVFGTHYLDAFTAQTDLDFFVTFSSLAAIGGNAGQCDYSYANHYMDAFATARNLEVAQGRRSGLTLSLNWSLWAQGGMQLDEQTEMIFKRTLGIKPLATDIGVGAFVKALQLNEPHLAVLEAEQEKIEIAWGLRAAPVAAEPAATEVTDTAADAPAAASGDLQNQVQDTLIDITIDFLKMDREDIDIDTILMDLGFDSIGLAAFANAVNDIYGTELTPILFFEYPNIREVAKHVATSFKAQAERVHQSGDSQPAAASKPAASAPAKAATPVASTSSVPAAIDKGFKVPVESARRSSGGLDMARRFVEVPIAIVGVSGAMPQSPDLASFWQNLVDEKDLVTEIPADRWDWKAFDGDPLKEKNKSYSRWGGFLNQVDKFDPMFFGITPREAQMMDPQQRLLVECVYSAIENSGQKVSDLSGTRTGFFVGVSAKDYVDLMAEMDLELDGYSASGTSHSILANRVSFLFNLQGPSAPLDTACSSSIIALHRAIESIHTGSSDMAIVAGVQVMLTPAAHIALSSAGMLSTDGKCKTFDQSANGYVRGEGVGAIFIKTLAQAEADGNPIQAVVGATSENHGGKVSMLTAPNPKAQADLLIEAYRKAEVDPASVGFIECHGTGTSLGDPIEIKALRSAFDTLYRDHDMTAADKPHCGLSAVKTNIGHLEPAAGMAGMLKAIMALQHRKIPALLNFSKLNPYIDLEHSPFYVVDHTVDWPAPVSATGKVLPRVAGISSFGWGGANAHAVLKEYQPPVDNFVPASGSNRLIVLSAKALDRLAEYAENLENFARSNSVDIDELAYTLQVGRDVMKWRLGVVASSVEQLVERLAALRQSGALAGDSLDREALKPLKDTFVGEANKSSEVLNFVSTDGDLQATIIDNLFGGAKWSQLLELWVKGMDIDWRRVYGDNTPRRTVLPTYPFAKERYWLPEQKAQAKAAAPAAEKPVVGRFIAAPTWRRERLANAAGATPKYAAQYLYSVGIDALTQQRVSELAGDYTEVVLGEKTQDPAQLYSANATACFELIQNLFKQKHKGRVLFQLLLGNDAEDLLLQGLSGLLKTAVLENPRLTVQILVVDNHIELSDATQRLRDNRADTRHDLIRYDRKVRWVRDWQPLTAKADSQPVTLRNDGVYLVTGGLGGLGKVFARHILEAAPGATVVLTGRSTQDERIDRQLADMCRDGDHLYYQAMNLSDADQVRQVLEAVRKEHGRLDGIIHSAGMVQDSFIVKKTPEQFAAVLEPKVLGSVNLDLASKDMALDFLVLFSSLSGVLGNIGQADYAAANGFMDNFAAWRDAQVAKGERSGTTLSLNWPLWAEGGMTVDNANQQLLTQATGMRPLTTDAGIEGLHLSLDSGQPQAVVLEGDMPKVEQFFLSSVRGLTLDAGRNTAQNNGAKDRRQVEQLMRLIKAELNSFESEVK